MDKYLEDKAEARQKILKVLKDVKKASDINPNQILVIAFIDAKSDELVNIFGEGTIQVRREAYNILTQLDPSQRGKFETIIKN